MRSSARQQILRNRMIEAIRTIHEIAEETGDTYGLVVSSSEVSAASSRVDERLMTANWLMMCPNDSFQLQENGPHDIHGLVRAVDLLVPRDPPEAVDVLQETWKK